MMIMAFKSKLAANDTDEWVHIESSGDVQEALQKEALEQYHITQYCSTVYCPVVQTRH